MACPIPTWMLCWVIQLHPTIAIGICLLRTTDVGLPVARRTSVNVELLSSADPHITTGSTCPWGVELGPCLPNMKMLTHERQQPRSLVEGLSVPCTCVCGCGVSNVDAHRFVTTNAAHSQIPAFSSADPAVDLRVVAVQPARQLRHCVGPFLAHF